MYVAVGFKAKLGFLLSMHTQKVYDNPHCFKHCDQTHNMEKRHLVNNRGHHPLNQPITSNAIQKSVINNIVN